MSRIQSTKSGSIEDGYVGRDETGGDIYFYPADGLIKFRLPPGVGDDLRSIAGQVGALNPPHRAVLETEAIRFLGTGTDFEDLTRGDVHVCGKYVSSNQCVDE